MGVVGRWEGGNGTMHDHGVLFRTGGHAKGQLHGGCAARQQQNDSKQQQQQQQQQQYATARYHDEGGRQQTTKRFVRARSRQQGHTVTQHGMATDSQAHTPMCLQHAPAATVAGAGAGCAGNDPNKRNASDSTVAAAYMPVTRICKLHGWSWCCTHSRARASVTLSICSCVVVKCNVSEAGRQANSSTAAARRQHTAHKCVPRVENRTADRHETLRHARGLWQARPVVAWLWRPHSSCGASRFQMSASTAQRSTAHNSTRTPCVMTPGLWEWSGNRSACDAPLAPSWGAQQVQTGVAWLVPRLAPFYHTRLSNRCDRGGRGFEPAHGDRTQDETK